MRRLLVIPISFAIGATIARASLFVAPRNVWPDLAQPVAVVTNWHQFGAWMSLVLCASIGAAFFAYASSLGGRPPTLRAVAAICTASLIAAWLWPVLFSSDAYAYAAYGELARLGLQVYARAPLPAGHALLSAAAWQWGNPLPACVYGPAFVALARATIEVAAPLGVRAQIDGVRALGSLAMLACVPLISAAWGGGSNGRRAAATIALNPVLLWSAAEGHNDAIALAIALLGVAIARRYVALGACVAVGAAAIKLPGALAVLGVGWLAGRERRVEAALGSLAGLAIVATLLVPWARGLLANLAPHGHYAPQASLQALANAAPALGPLVALAASAWCALRGARALVAGDRSGWAMLAVGAWLAIPNPYAWYCFWIVPVAAVAPRNAASQTLLGLSLAAVLRYLPDAIAAATPAMGALLAIGACAPLLLLIAPKRPKRDGRTYVESGSVC